MVKWFTFDNEIVDGPFSTAELKTFAENGQLSDSVMVWGRVQTQWVNVNDWLGSVDDLVHNGKVYSFDSKREWHYGAKGNSFGPFSRPELVSILNEQDTLDGILLWTSGMKDWTPLFEFHDILEEMGVNKRRHKRAQIDGTVLLTLSSGEITSGKLVTISEGGLGFIGISDLTPGETVQLEIVSPIFKRNIRVAAEIQYVSDNNFVGVSFKKIHSEAISQIISYVRQVDAKSAPFYNHKKSA